MLELRNVKKNYDGDVSPALDGVNLKTTDRGLYFLTGEREGLSSLLAMIAGMDTEMDGSILFGEETISSFSAAEFTKLRFDKIAYIPKGENLLFGMTAEQNMNIGRTAASGDDTEALTVAALEFVGLRCYQKTRVENLTELERKKISIAATYLKKADLILFDEPYCEFDEEEAGELVAFLSELAKESLVIITTTIKESAERAIDMVGGIILTLEGGKIISERTAIVEISDIDTANCDDIIAENASEIIDKTSDEILEVSMIEQTEKADNLDSAEESNTEIIEAASAENNYEIVVKTEQTLAPKRGQNKALIQAKKKTGATDFMKIALLQIRKGKARFITLLVLLVFALTSAGLGVGAAFFYGNGREQLRVYKKSGQELSFLKNADIFNTNGVKTFTDKENADIDAKFKNANIAPVYYSGGLISVVSGFNAPSDGYKMNPYGYTILDENNFREKSFTMFSGKLPETKMEVALTKFIAESMLGTNYCAAKGILSLEDFVGKRLILKTNEGIEFTICGIVDTKANEYYEEVKEKVKKNSGEDDSAEILKEVWKKAMNLSVHRAVIVQSDFISEIYKRAPESGFSYKSPEESNILRRSQMYSYSYAKDIQKFDIFMGDKTTIADNEIILSINAVKVLINVIYGDDYIKIDEVRVKEVLEKGLYVFGVKKDDETVAEPMKVVGYINTNKISGIAIVSDDMFTNLTTATRGVVSYSCFLADTNITENLKAAKYLMKSDVVVNSFMSVDVDAARINAKIIAIVCGAFSALLLLASLIVAIIGTFWSVGMNGDTNNKLRIMGVSERKIKFIYLAENIFICMGALIISFILVFPIAALLSFSGKTYSLLLSPVAMNLPTILIMVAIAGIVVVIGSASMIFKRKKYNS